MSELHCPYCGFNCEVPSNIEEKIECPSCRNIFLYIQKSKSHGTIDYRPSPEINDRSRQMSELKHQLMLNKNMSWVPCYLKSEVDKVITELEENHKKEVSQLLILNRKLKSDIADLRDGKKLADTILDERNTEISELQERIDELQKATGSAWSKVNAMYDELRHHKYKRCLDKAKICQLRHERYEQYVTKYKDCNGPTIQRWKFLKSHYEKWYKHWLELAEKFKEAK